MKKGAWGRAIHRMNRAEEKEQALLMGQLDRKKKKNRGKKALLLLFSLLVFSAAAFYFIFDVGSWQRLDMTKIVNIPQTGAIYDMDGNFIARVQSTQNRVSIPLDQVPRDVQNAFLAAEDLALSLPVQSSSSGPT